MAQDAYLKLSGIDGPVTEPGREGSIRILAVDHGVQTPDSSRLVRRSTRTRAGAQHDSLVITKEVDKTSPLLMKSLLRGEILPQLELRFWQSGGRDREFQFYTIELEDIRITEIELEMLHNRYPENADHKEYEYVSFDYKKIRWTFEDGGISTEWDVEEGR